MPCGCAMSESVSQADIARVLGLSRAAVCKAVAKGMPTDSIEAAKSWRDARPKRRLSAKERDEATGTMSPPADVPAAGVATGIATTRTLPKLEGGDYDELMVTQAGIVALSAFEFYTEALKSGNTTLIAGAIKNWADAAKAAAILRERFLETREKALQIVNLERYCY